MFRMLQADLDRTASRLDAIRIGNTRVIPVPTQAVIQTLDVASGNDLAQSAVLRVSDLDEIAVEKQDVRAVDGGGLGFADKLHDDAARDVAVLVDVDGALLVGEKEFAVAEPEHAEWFEFLDACGDGADVRGFGVGDGERELLVEGEDFDAAGSGDGEGGVEQIECIGIGRDVEIVKVAEKLGGAAAG